MGWTGHLACMKEMRNTNILVGKQKVKMPLHNEVWYENVDWIRLALVGDRLRAFVNVINTEIFTS
jgi:hypothetical protein